MEVAVRFALPAQLRVAVDDRTAVAEARRQAASLRLAAGAADELALAVTEAATNIVKHAGRGEILMRRLAWNGAVGAEVLAIDAGPGIANMAEAMRDGHSTAGSPGTGLGTIQRIGSHFQIWSRPGKGTLLRFEVWARAIDAAPAPAGAVSLPLAGEAECGDGWSMVEERGRRVLFVVDGLGHGADAAMAARAAIAAVEANAARAPAHIMQAVDAALRPTRGAAACVAVIPAGGSVCTFCGVGNISASIHAGGVSRSMVSYSGILGHQVRKVQEFQYPYPAGALCVIHSDGLATRWNLNDYPGLGERHPALIAAALYRDFRRGRDDVTVMAVRNA